MGAATIRGQLLLFSVSSKCSYYSRAATIWGAASIQINMVCDFVNNTYLLISSKSLVRSLAVFIAMDSTAPYDNERENKHNCIQRTTLILLPKCGMSYMYM